MENKKLIFYAVSDATGDLAVNITISAVRQFEFVEPNIRRRARIDTPEKVSEVIAEARETGGFIIYTFVSPELRQDLQEKAKAQNVPVVDVMGPTLKQLTDFVHANPSDLPGRQYTLTQNYYQRNDAVEFTVKHDDGLGLDTLNNADIIILGISRTSKTPLSMYLAFRGYRVANVPIVKNVELPTEIFATNRNKMVGVIVDPESLASWRTSRMNKLGRSLNEEYVNIEYIKEEFAYQRKLFAQLGNIPMINVTKKAIEESATEILTVLGK